MAGSVLLTGANGSLAIHVVRYYLQHHPEKTLILTVRDTSASDVNTKHLQDTIAEFPNAKASVRQLDLSNLAAVKEFAADLSKGDTPKLDSIICNAYFWNLTGAPQATGEGYEKTFQINHIAHAALVLGLLDHFQPEGRILLFTSDAHWPGKNSLEKHAPIIPSDLNELAKPPTNEPEAEHTGRGFQRYALSKLVILIWTYALNHHLEQNPKYAKITAIAMNPGNLTDSRALRVNTPKSLQLLSRFLLQPMRPLLRFADPTMRTSRDAGIDVAKLAANEIAPGERGFFTLAKKDTSSPDSLDAKVQEAIWEKTFEWTKVSKDVV